MRSLADRVGVYRHVRTFTADTSNDIHLPGPVLWGLSLALTREVNLATPSSAPSAEVMIEYVSSPRRAIEEGKKENE